ncbi:lachesin-like [Macrobrachium rosenbergii]|uniref:lachesin-like n=1 Tax=Macrobrachium rosenbergii TaxID=79674 RepID=UPI0034D7B8F5
MSGLNQTKLWRGAITALLLLLLFSGRMVSATRGSGDHGFHSMWKRASSGPLPEFTEHVNNATVVVGRNAAFKCSVKNLGTYQIAWVTKDSQTLLAIGTTMIIRNYRLKVHSSDNTTWFLYIEQVRLSDRGFYMCQINTRPMQAQSGYLKVVVPPNIIDDESSTDVEVSEDAPAQLRCAANGFPAPDIHFKREDGHPIRYAANGINGAQVSSNTIFHTPKTKIRSSAEAHTLSVNAPFDSTTPSSASDHLDGLEQKTAVLSFESVKRTDMGHYLCIANNSVPPSVSKRMVLNVRYSAPDVHVSLQMIGVFLGDDVAINCSVTAYPRPVVLWQDSNGKMIISGGRYEVRESQVRESPPELHTTLIIRSVTSEDISTYRCNASIDNDKNREKSLSVQLNEISRPSTESSAPFDVPYKGLRPPKNMQKSLSKQSSINDIPERFEKPTSFLPGNKPDVLGPSTTQPSPTNPLNAKIRYLDLRNGLTDFDEIWHD